MLAAKSNHIQWYVYDIQNGKLHSMPIKLNDHYYNMRTSILIVCFQLASFVSVWFFALNGIWEHPTHSAEYNSYIGMVQC